MKRSKALAVSLALVSFSLAQALHAANTLIEVHQVEIYDSGKLSKPEKVSGFTLMNIGNGDLERFSYRKTRSRMQLEPGIWCFKSLHVTGTQHEGIRNSMCFKVEEKGITNAGTWVIGLRLDLNPPIEVWAKILQINDTHEELASRNDVAEYQKARLFRPKPQKE